MFDAAKDQIINVRVPFEWKDFTDVWELAIDTEYRGQEDGADDRRYRTRVFEGHRGTDRRPKILQYFIYAELCTYLKTMFLVRRS